MKGVPLVGEGFAKYDLVESAMALRSLKNTAVVLGIGLASPFLFTSSHKPVRDRVHPQAAKTQALEKDTFYRRNGQIYIPVRSIDQGHSNGCGTTSLAMALNALSAMAHNNPQHSPFTREALDEGNRELDSFSSPGMLARVAQENGAFAEMYNHVTFEEIKSHIDQGHPLIALVKVDEERANSFSGLHYVVIFDYEDEPASKYRSIIFADPGNGTLYEREFDKFMPNYAENLTLRGLPILYNRFMIALSHKNDLPPSRDVPITNRIATEMNDCINLFGSFVRAINPPRNDTQATPAPTSLAQGSKLP